MSAAAAALRQIKAGWRASSTLCMKAASRLRQICGGGSFAPWLDDERLNFCADQTL